MYQLIYQLYNRKDKNKEKEKEAGNGPPLKTPKGCLSKYICAGSDGGSSVEPLTSDPIDLGSYLARIFFFFSSGKINQLEMRKCDKKILFLIFIISKEYLLQQPLGSP